MQWKKWSATTTAAGQPGACITSAVQCCDSTRKHHAATNPELPPRDLLRLCVCDIKLLHRAYQPGLSFIRFIICWVHQPQHCTCNWIKKKWSQESQDNMKRCKAVWTKMLAANSGQHLQAGEAILAESPPRSYQPQNTGGCYWNGTANCDNPITRSTQPCIPPGSLNRVPASAGVKAGMSPLPGGR